MKLTTQRSIAYSCFGLFLGLSVNSRMTAAWLTPSTRVTVKSRQVLRRRSSNPQYIPTTTIATASAAAAKMKLNGDNNQNQVSPRKALEVMNEADLHQSDDVDDRSSTAPPEEISSITVMTQAQQQEHFDILLGHPIAQRILGEDDELSVQQKVINLLFLSAAFGYAIYTIFNIDSGMTRGWTAQEQLMRIPLDNWGAYESYLANKPIITKTLINVIIYLLGDWLSQTAFQGKHVLNFDISRTMRNGFIGLCFGPLVHQYYEFSDAILPPENGLVTRLEKIAMDQTLYLTIKCSIYISAVGLLAGEEWATVRQTVKDKIGGVVLTAWKFWPIVHCITYSLIPAQHRILWVNCVDLVWNAILASQAQRKESVFEEKEGEEEEALSKLSVSVLSEPLVARNAEPSPAAIVNDTAAPLIIDDLGDLQSGNHSDAFNTTETRSTEAIIVG